MATHLAKVAVEAHVRTATDGQKKLVDVRDLEDDYFWDCTAQCHEDTSALAQVRYRLSVGKFLLDALVHRLSWNSGNVPAHVGRHDGRACAAVDCDLNLKPFVRRCDVAHVVPPLLRQQADVSLRPVISRQWRSHGFRLVWVPLCVLKAKSSRAPAILSTHW